MDLLPIGGRGSKITDVIYARSLGPVAAGRAARRRRAALDEVEVGGDLGLVPELLADEEGPALACCIIKLLFK